MSPIEDLFAAALERAGISYEKNVPACNGKYRVDFFFRQHSRAVELDGFTYHEGLGQEKATADKKREREIERTEGWKVTRFSGGEVRADPYGCVAELKELLRDGNKPGASEVLPDMENSNRASKAQKKPTVQISLRRHDITAGESASLHSCAHAQSWRRDQYKRAGEILELTINPDTIQVQPAGPESIAATMLGTDKNGREFTVTAKATHPMAVVVATQNDASAKDACLKLFDSGTVPKYLTYALTKRPTARRDGKYSKNDAVREGKLKTWIDNTCKTKYKYPALLEYAGADILKDIPELSSEQVAEAYTRKFGADFGEQDLAMALYDLSIEGNEDLAALVDKESSYRAFLAFQPYSHRRMPEGTSRTRLGKRFGVPAHE